jgi:hypothetical protein
MTRVKKLISIISKDQILFVQILFLWLGIIYAQLTLTPAEFPDTPSYMGDPKTLDGYFSLAGHSIRAWPTVLIFWLAQSTYQITLIHSFLYGISWSFLIFAWVKNKDQVSKLLTGLLIVIFALTPRVLQWNGFLLSESLTVSLTILAASFLRLAIKVKIGEKSNQYSFNSFWFFSSIIFFSLAATNRASLILLPFLPIFLLLLSFKKKLLSMRFLAGGLIVAIMAMLYPIAYNSTTNQHWGGYGHHLTRSSFYFLYNTSYGSLQPEWADMLWQNIEDQAPTCLEDYRGSGTDPGRNPYYQAELMVTKCPEGVLWLNENFDSAYFEFIARHPVSTVRYMFEMINLVQDSTPYPSTTIIPSPFAKIFDSTYDGNHVFRPIIGWLVLALLAIAGLVFQSQTRKFETILAALTVVFGVMSISLTQLFIVSEPVRITTPATALTIAGCVILTSEFFRRKTN